MTGWIPSPGLEHWLTRGGDSRIELNRQGVNGYGYPPHPLQHWHGFGACTASAISPLAYEAARHLHERLPDPLPPESGLAEWQRIRARFMAWTHLDDLAGLRLVLAASGSDAHRLAAWLTRNQSLQTWVSVMADPAETGSRIPAMLQNPGEAGHERLQIIPVRNADSHCRPSAQVDADFEEQIHRLQREGHGVRLIGLDVSKTGRVIPEAATVFRIRQRYGPVVPVIIDASQFRLSAAELRRYLEADCLVIVTGSKFLGGPAFAGALLIPGSVARERMADPLPTSLVSSRSEWPDDWTGAGTLPSVCNRGLLLRWEAALAELDQFRQLPEAGVKAFIRHFTATVSDYLTCQPLLQPLDTTPPDATPSGILPFLPKNPKTGMPVGEADTWRIFRALPRSGFSLGQPVVCGHTRNQNLAALRLALSASLVRTGLTHPDQVTQWALEGLEQVVRLIKDLNPAAR